MDRRERCCQHIANVTKFQNQDSIYQVCGAPINLYCVLLHEPIGFNQASFGQIGSFTLQAINSPFSELVYLGQYRTILASQAEHIILISLSHIDINIELLFVHNMNRLKRKLEKKLNYERFIQVKHSSHKQIPLNVKKERQDECFIS